MSDATDLAALAHICDYLRRENRILRGLLTEAIDVLAAAPGAARSTAKASELLSELADLDARRSDPMVRA